jgi:hypothetical protein
VVSKVGEGLHELVHLHVQHANCRHALDLLLSEQLVLKVLGLIKRKKKTYCEKITCITLPDNFDFHEEEVQSSKLFNHTIFYEGAGIAKLV